MTGSAITPPLRVLMVSPRFAPIADPEAFCGAKMAMALLDAGVDLQVLYDRRYLDLPQVSRDTSAMWKRLETVTTETEPVSRHLLGGIYSSVRYLAYSRWAHVALRRARALHAEKPFDLVYSRSLPMQAHVVGYWCARALGLPWVVNINDPWDIRVSPVKGEDAPSPVRAALSAYWLRKTLRSADLVTFPCERLGRHTTQGLEPPRPFEVIPHIGLTVPAEPDAGVFRVLHAGLLGLRYGRSSARLLEGLRKFLAVCPEAREVTKLTFIGPDVRDTATCADALGDLMDVDGIARALCDLFDAHRSGTLDRRRPSQELRDRFAPAQIVRRFLAICERAGIRKRT